MTTQNKHIGFPNIDPATRYDTTEAAKLLEEKPDTLRQWRFRKRGPRYYQTTANGKVMYRGQWLIEFREASIVEPAK